MKLPFPLAALAVAALAFGAPDARAAPDACIAGGAAIIANAYPGLHPGLFAGRLAAIREHPLFDLALVNVVPEQILPEMPGLVRLLRPGGGAILSVILQERGRQVLDRMRGLGLVECDRRTAGDWVAFRVGPGA